METTSIIIELRFISKPTNIILESKYNAVIYISPTKSPFIIHCFFILKLLIELPINILTPETVITTAVIVFSEMFVLVSNIA